MGRRLVPNLAQKGASSSVTFSKTGKSTIFDTFWVKIATFSGRAKKRDLHNELIHTSLALPHVVLPCRWTDRSNLL